MSSQHIISFYILLLLGVLTSSCLKDTNENLTFDSFEPVNLGDGLILSNPTDENVNPVALTDIYNDVYADDNLWSLRSLLVFRNGKLISEAYLKDKLDITNKHIVWSMTKQVMGVLTGIALDKGLINDIDDPISNYFDDELINYQDKGDITIRNLITMQSGIDYNNETQTDEILQQIPENSVEFILNRSISTPPGTTFHYNDGNPHLISAIIQKMTNKPTDEWAHEALFSKIEMTNYNWIRYRDGTTLGGFGIETTPRELSKIALCVSNNGKWKGEQIVKSSWIEEMTTVQVQTNSSQYAFGYFWWIDTLRDIHFMWGVGGQFAFIVPGENLVIIMTSFPNTKGDYEIQADEALSILDKIVNATN